MLFEERLNNEIMVVDHDGFCKFRLFCCCAQEFNMKQWWSFVTRKRVQQQR